MPTDQPIEEATSGDLIDRAETGIRVLFTLLFFLIARVAEAVLGIVIVFGGLYTLITQHEPSPAVRRFSQRVLAYLVEIARYLAYNDDDAPFPFREFPPEPD